MSVPLCRVGDRSRTELGERAKRSDTDSVFLRQHAPHSQHEDSEGSLRGGGCFWACFLFLGSLLFSVPGAPEEKLSHGSWLQGCRHSFEGRNTTGLASRLVHDILVKIIAKNDGSNKNNCSSNSNNSGNSIGNNCNTNRRSNSNGDRNRSSTINRSSNCSNSNNNNKIMNKHTSSKKNNSKNTINYTNRKRSNNNTSNNKMNEEQ